MFHTRNSIYRVNLNRYNIKATTTNIIKIIIILIAVTILIKSFNVVLDDWFKGE